MELIWPAKDPDEVLDYRIDWYDDGDGPLGDDLIVDSDFTLEVAAGLTIDTQSNTYTESTVWLSGGTHGLTAKIKCTIVTDGGRTFERTVDLPIGQTEPVAAGLDTLPISLDQAKAILQIETEGLDAAGAAQIDAAVSAALRAAVEYAEQQTGFTLRRRYITVKMNAWPAFPYRIKAAPIRDVRSITYYDENNATQTLDADDWDYSTTEDGADLFLLDNVARPSLYYRPDAVMIEVDAGFDPAGTLDGTGESFTLPATIEQAILLLTGMWFNARDDADRNSRNRIPSGAGDLFDSGRLFR